MDESSKDIAMELSQPSEPPFKRIPCYPLQISPLNPLAGHGSLRLLLSLSCRYIPFLISITASLSLLLMTSLFLFKCVFNMRVGKRFMTKTSRWLLCWG
ncbi:hypothetical protein L873DRAFT_1803860 [Choiromyces venosus 120613-1]|uniref:Uncharacterized protein n=1 Tax=Choiromyces venosus 120613-1 TaxID=1336337 RepID=A0A3N4JYX1_9PEZI|nr:hypothetical protein L873DRAFT_1803860 [Choiromyces venosus 120613-1]